MTLNGLRPAPGGRASGRSRHTSRRGAANASWERAPRSGDHRIEPLGVVDGDDRGDRRSPMPRHKSELSAPPRPKTSPTRRPIRTTSGDIPRRHPVGLGLAQEAGRQAGAPDDPPEAEQIQGAARDPCAAQGRRSAESVELVRLAGRDDGSHALRRSSAMPATHQTPPSTAASPPRKLSTGQRLPQVARSESPTRSASCAAPAQPCRRFQITNRGQPEPHAQHRHDPESRPEQFSDGAAGRAARTIPTEAGNARTEYFAMTPRAADSPATTQARRSSDPDRAERPHCSPGPAADERRVGRDDHPADREDRDRRQENRREHPGPARVQSSTPPAGRSPRRSIRPARRPAAGPRTSTNPSASGSIRRRPQSPAGSARRSAGLGNSSSSPAAATTPSIPPRPPQKSQSQPTSKKRSWQAITARIAPSVQRP